MRFCCSVEGAEFVEFVEVAFQVEHEFFFGGHGGVPFS